MLRARENTDVFITLDDNIYGIHNKRVNILYVFYIKIFIANKIYIYIYICYIAINIKWLKCGIKTEELACRYHTISAHLLDIAHLLGCLLILPLHDVAFDDAVMQWRRAKPCHAQW